MEDLDLNTEKLEEEVAKLDGEETKSETTADKTSEKKETSEEESTRTDTSLKTEEEESKEVKEEDEDTRFDKHPRWQKLKQERDNAIDKSRQFDELKGKLEDFEVDELTKLKEAGKLLRKYPELAEKVQKVIDEHPFDNEAVKGEISDVKQSLEKLQSDILLEKYDSAVGKLISENKVDKELEPLVKEVFDNRVINQKISFGDLPKAFEKLLKDINLIQRKTLASHIKVKSEETRVPATPTQKGKMIAQKSESAEAQDVVEELTQGLKSSTAEFKEE